MPQMSMPERMNPPSIVEEEPSGKCGHYFVTFCRLFVVTLFSFFARFIVCCVAVVSLRPGDG